MRYLDCTTGKTPLTDADGVLQVLHRTFRLDPELPGLRAALQRTVRSAAT